jgi:hypothetical protein
VNNNVAPTRALIQFQHLRRYESSSSIINMSVDQYPCFNSRCTYRSCLDFGFLVQQACQTPRIFQTLLSSSATGQEQGVDSETSSVDAEPSESDKIRQSADTERPTKTRLISEGRNWSKTRIAGTSMKPQDATRSEQPKATTPSRTQPLDTIYRRHIAWKSRKRSAKTSSSH